MKDPFGGLLAFLTLMVSAMALYINLGNMLRGDPLTAINGIASCLFLLAWMALTAYSIANGGAYCFLLNVFWFFSLIGAVFCMATISGITRVLEYAAYLLLFLLAPLFGFRVVEVSHFTWAAVMAGVSFCFAVASLVAAGRQKPAEAVVAGEAGEIGETGAVVSGEAGAMVSGEAEPGSSAEAEAMGLGETGALVIGEAELGISAEAEHLPNGNVWLPAHNGEDVADEGVPQAGDDVVIVGVSQAGDAVIEGAPQVGDAVPAAAADAGVDAQTTIVG